MAETVSDLHAQQVSDLGGGGVSLSAYCVETLKEFSGTFQHIVRF